MTTVNTLSVEKLLSIRAEAFATVKHHSAKIVSIAGGIEEFDNAIQSHVAGLSTDAQAALLAAGQRLASLLESEGMSA